eukprot:Pgem_evm1s6130
MLEAVNMRAIRRRRRNEMPDPKICRSIENFHYQQNFQEDDEMLANLLLNTKMTSFHNDTNTSLSSSSISSSFEYIERRNSNTINSFFNSVNNMSTSCGNNNTNNNSNGNISNSNFNFPPLTST